MASERSHGDVRGYTENGEDLIESDSRAFDMKVGLCQGSVLSPM